MAENRVPPGSPSHHLEQGKDLIPKQETETAGKGLPVFGKEFEVSPPAENPESFCKHNRSPGFVFGFSFSLKGFVVAPVGRELDALIETDPFNRPKGLHAHGVLGFKESPEQFNFIPGFIHLLDQVGVIRQGISCELEAEVDNLDPGP